MIGYLTISMNDLGRAVEFYDALLATTGIQKLWQHGARDCGKPDLAIYADGSGSALIKFKRSNDS